MCKIRQKCSLSSFCISLALSFQFFGAKLEGGAICAVLWLTFVENQFPPAPKCGRCHKTPQIMSDGFSAKRLDLLAHM